MERPAPANGLKLIALVLGVFILVAIYGQWQHARRAQTESAIVVPAPTAAPAVSPNENR